MQNLQNKPKVPNQLCQQIINHELQLQSGVLTEALVSKIIQLYMEAMNIYIIHPSYSLYTQSTSRNQRNSVIPRGHQYYQQKIKKLLIRKDVQKCLVGHTTNPKAIDLKNQLQKVQQSAPEQAKALLQYFKKFHQQQEALIKKTVQQQNIHLQQRIQRRSRSKSNRQNSALKQNCSILANLNIPNCGKPQKSFGLKNIGLNLGM